MAHELTETWPPRWKGTAFKEARGTHVLERKQKRAEVKTHERKEKQAAKKVAPGCRWPRADHGTPRHICLGQLEAAHRVAIGLGGDKDGSRTDRRDLLVVCTHIHLGDDGIDRHARKWEPLTDKGALGPVSFWRRQPSETKPGEWGEWTCVGVERSPGVLEKVAKESAPGVVER